MRDFSQQAEIESIGSFMRDGRAADGGAASEPQRPAGFGASGEPSESEQRRARLLRTIEGEIVPRLVMTRRTAGVPAGYAGHADAVPNASDVKELVRLLLAHEVVFAAAFVDTVRQRGVSLDLICLELLTPAARGLGELWEEDECDFMQVTVGLCRLHQLLRQVSPEFRSEEADVTRDRRILLTLCPGEQHTFGVALVAQFLRRAGWDVWQEFAATSAETLDLVRQHYFAVVGLSFGTESRLDYVTSTIRQIRQTSRNRLLGVLVGGPIVVGRPELANLVGADGTAMDGPEAVERADRMSALQEVALRGRRVKGTGRRASG